MNIDSIMHPTTPSKAELNAGLQLLVAVAETIREVKEVPSGTIYAALLGRLTYNGYMGLLASLKGAGLIEERPNHILRWIGPDLEVRA